MNEIKKIRDPQLGELTFRRIEESKAPNVITYILETRDGLFARVQRLKRYNVNDRRIILPCDIQNKRQEIAEMNHAIKELTGVLKTVNAPPPVGRNGWKPVLGQKIGNIKELALR